jgi:hypothetical protein
MKKPILRVTKWLKDIPIAADCVASRSSVRDRLITDHKKLNTSRNCNEKLIATLLICTARNTP